MSDAPTFDVQAAHRYFAAHCFNACWQLMDKTDRTPDDDARMVRLTLTSLYHWGEWAGVNDTNLSVGYWQASRVYCLVGQAEEAARYGERCRSVSRDLPPFYRAYALEGLARAEAVRGNPDAAQEYAGEALALATALTDPDERQTLVSDLATLPASMAPASGELKK